jgi:uncharacterized phage protein gp47/JayE
MASIENQNRFSLPVETFITTLLAESFPALNVAPGSAFYDLFVSSASLIFQQMRDRARVIQRNQSFDNYQTMLPEELDRITANYFVERRPGNKSSGTQRVIFNTLQNVTITPSAVFTTDAGLVFNPITTTIISATTLALNVLSSTSEYYVDVNCVSEDSGDATAVLAGEVTGFSGIAGAIRTTNLYDYFGGTNAESNSHLYERTKSSLTNRDLVKAPAFETVILSNFQTVRSLKVQGFGDEHMDRDVISATLANSRLFEQSFCQKVNLPLGADGEVAWLTDGGTAITAPIGGFVGAIFDLTGKDFNAFSVTLDGEVYETVSAQPNFRVRLLSTDDADYVDNDFTVTRVEEVPVVAGGPDVKIIRLDRPFKDATLINPVTDLAHYPYTLIGSVATNKFHVGGKVDIYVDSIADATKTVIVSVLPPVNSSTTDVSEVPLTETFLDPITSSPLFEDGTGFSSPVIAITKVEQLDPSNDQVVLKELTPETHYVLVRQESRGRFTQSTSDVLIIRGSETLADLGLTIPMFVGQRVRITYTTNPDIPLIQAFVDDPVNKDITKDVMVYAPDTAIFNIDLQYRGTLSSADVTTILSEYVKETRFGAEITVNEIVTALSYFGVTDVVMPVTLRSRLDLGDGTTQFTESTDRISVESNQLFTPDPDLQVTKLG